MPIQTVNPATGDLVRTFEPLSDEALATKLQGAAEAAEQQRILPMEHRALCMRKLALLLDEERAELARTITLEMGKPITAAEAEVAKCASACRYYAEHAARIIAPELLSTEGGQAYVQYEPLGVVLAVMPWNFPFWQVFRFAAPALMAGNVCLLKHAPNVPQCALLMEGLVRRAGFPRGAVSALLIENPQVESVLADPRVAAVTVTGGETAGRAIAAQAGWLLKKSVLELGGSDPFVVMQSADLQAAISAAVQARLVNGGQSCIAAKRFIVQEEVYAEFLRGLVQAFEAVRIGDPMRRETTLGPLATVRQVDTLEQQVKAAVAAGGRVVYGGARLVGRGFYFEPTILTGVPRTASVYHDEIFGPVAMVFRARDLEEAIEIANDTPFGLGASVWTKEPAEQQQLISRIQSGMVFLNAMVASDPRMPFGGTKRSGYGRELAAHGMHEFLSAKTVYIA